LGIVAYFSSCSDDDGGDDKDAEVNALNDGDVFGQEVGRRQEHVLRQ